MALYLPQSLNIATYGASTSGTVATGTAIGNIASVLYLWHTATNTKRIEIYKITASFAAGAANYFSIRGNFITAENASPGGATVTGSPIDRGDPASLLTSTTGIIRSGATGAPTRVSGDVFSEAVSGGAIVGQFTLFDIASAGKPIVLRASTAEGFEVRTVIGASALSTASQIGCTIYWTET